MLGACSSSEDVDGGGTAASKGDGYMSVTVNLPTRSANFSRAANDKYEDGLAKEYDVKNGILALFDASGKSAEGEYTLLGAYNLDLTEKESDPDNDNITTTHSVVTKIQSTASTDVYALVFLNHNNILTATDGKLMNGTTDLTGKKYSEIVAVTTDNAMNGTGFFMANAPLSASEGGAASTAPDGKFTTLAKVDMSKIKETREEALNNSAVSVFVERSVAKVSLKASDGNTTDDNLAYKFDGWVLDNTTNASYIVRNMGDKAGEYLKYSSEKFGTSPNYRFIGNVKLGETSAQPKVDLYRTYWCVDPTYNQAYDETTHAAAFTTVKAASDVTKWNASEAITYCHENTFDVDHMNYQNTTRALVKLTFNGGKKFYTSNGGNAILDTDDKRNDAVLSYVLGTTDVNIVELKTWLTANQTAASTKWENTDFELTWATAPDNKGILKVTAIGLSAAGKAKLKSGDTDFDGWDKIVEQLNTNRIIRQYENGAAYYEVRIKHFAGEKDTDLAPWNTWETTKPTASIAYPGNKEQNYLGRYGLVRNNWYDIDVTAVKKIGSPVVPNITTDKTTDDNIDAYISAKINVLSWAKRTQSTTLK